jgi:Phage regulatory protein Rha (Phage_pRha)
MRPEVIMTRDGFAILAMGFTGAKAMQWKLKFLDAFNAMEQRLAKESDKLEWKAARLQIGQVRRSFTDTIKHFVEYATAQGSESAFRYYQLLTTMEYKALGLLEMQKTALGNFRDTLDLMDISHLQVAEMTAKGALQHAMDVKMHYKEAFQFAKQKVTAYAEAVSFLRIAEK